MTSIYTQETMLFHTTFYVTNRSAECGMEHLSSLIIEHLEQKEQLSQAVNKLVNQLHHTQMLLEKISQRKLY